MEIILDDNDVLTLVPSPADVVAHVTAILEHFAALVMTVPRFITSPRLQVCLNVDRVLSLNGGGSLTYAAVLWQGC